MRRSLTSDNLSGLLSQRQRDALEEKKTPEKKPTIFLKAKKPNKFKVKILDFEKIAQEKKENNR